MGLPIEFKGFLMREASNVLIMQRANYPDIIKFMKKHDIRHLEINPNYFEPNELDFLDQFIFLEGLTILSMSIKDISPIQNLVNLRCITIQHKLKGNINFELFPKLEDCFFEWGTDGSDTIFNAYSLKKLRIEKFNGVDLKGFYNLKQLVDLSIRRGKIHNLEGIQNLTRLIKVDLTACSQLEVIDRIKYLESLEILRLDFCKKIVDLNSITGLTKLKSLSLNNMGTIPTIEFLFELTNLKELFFTDNTNIVDGNLNVLKFLYEKRNLQNVIFQKRRHYSHKPEELGYKMPDIVKRIFKKR